MYDDVTLTYRLYQLQWLSHLLLTPSRMIVPLATAPKTWTIDKNEVISPLNAQETALTFRQMMESIWSQI